MTLSAEQSAVRIQALSALATIAIVVSACITISGNSANFPAQAAWARSAILMLLWLMAVIATRANQRFFHRDEIDGSAPPANSSSEINAHVLQNTLEQTVLILTLTLALCILRPPFWYPMLLAVTLLFSAGRAAFWWGYHHHPVMRGYGFGLTFYPSLLLALYLGADLLHLL